MYGADGKDDSESCVRYHSVSDTVPHSVAMGILHPEVLEKFGIPHPTSVLEMTIAPFV